MAETNQMPVQQQQTPQVQVQTPQAPQTLPQGEVQEAPKKRTWLKVLLIIVVLLVAGLGVYYWLKL